jgi:hypothetical protein
MRNVFGLVVKADRNPLAGRFLVEHENLLPNESKIADIIGTALEELRAGAFGQSMMNALQSGNAANAVANLDWGKFGQTLSTMRLPLEQQLAASGTGEAKALGDVIGHMAFNVTDPRAIEWAANRAGELVVTTSQAVRDDIRGVITSAFVNQTNPREIAGMIDRQVGLFPRWANAVENRFQSSLTSFMGGGMSYGDAHDRAQNLADAYRERLIDKRCTMIARTEVIRAANEGRAQSWQQAADAGLIDPATTTKEWIAESDACDECSDLDTEEVLMDDDFSSGDDMPPAHPNCRCTAVLVPDGEPTPKEEPVTPETDTLPATSVEDITPPADEEPQRPEPTLDPQEAVDRLGVDTLSNIVASSFDGKYCDAAKLDSGLSSLLGYNELPQVVARSEFDSMVRDGKIVEAFRGTFGADAASHAEQFRSGELFPGRGIYGNGTYTTLEEKVAVQYANNKPENVFSMAAAPQARIIDYADAKAIADSFSSQLFEHPPVGLSREATDNLWILTRDPGRMASILGYDAIRVPPAETAHAQDFFVFLNRSQVITPR